jgi:hypothetical protein
MNIQQATEAYKAWLGKRLILLPANMELKHQRMAESRFPFLRATFYRRVQSWPEVWHGRDFDFNGLDVIILGLWPVAGGGYHGDDTSRLIWRKGRDHMQTLGGGGTCNLVAP